MKDPSSQDGRISRRAPIECLAFDLDDTLYPDREVAPPAPAWGTRMVRYWDEVFYDERGRPFALPDGLDHLAR